MSKPSTTWPARPREMLEPREPNAAPEGGPTQPRAAEVARVAAIITVGFMGSVIVTPLYALYQRKFGFSEITLTLVYAVYVVGNVAALLLFGQLSDQAGRKRAGLCGLAFAAIGALLFLFAAATLWLFVGRFLFGLGAGVASGTGTAWLAEQYGADRRPAATLAATTANLSGIAIGPLLGGLLAQYAPWPLRLPFLIYVAILLAVVIGLAGTKEPRRARISRIADLRIHPRVGVPSELIGSFTPPAIAAFVTFALGGLYFALIPSIVIHDLHQHNVAIGGLVVFELGLVAAGLVVLARRLPPTVAMTIGLLTLIPAVALVVAAQAARSMPLLVVAAAVGGTTLALGYRGSLQVVNDIAPEDRRAELMSSYYIACFVGNSVPVIGIGVLATITSALPASIVFAGVIAAFSLSALAWRLGLRGSVTRSTAPKR